MWFLSDLNPAALQGNVIWANMEKESKTVAGEQKEAF